MVINFFEQSVGYHVSVTADEYEHFGEKLAVVAAHLVHGKALVLAVDAGNEQAVELVFFLRRQAVDERVGQIGHGAAEIGHAVILRELLCVALSVGVGRLLLIIVIAAVRLLLLLLLITRETSVRLLRLPVVVRLLLCLFAGRFLRLFLSAREVLRIRG